MKLHALFSVFLITAFHNADCKSNPIVLLYYPARSMYLLSDKRTVTRTLQEKKNSEFTNIILLCPTLNHTPKVTEKYLEIKSIHSASEKKIDFKKCPKYESKDPSPFLITDVTENAAFTKGSFEEQYEHEKIIHTMSFHVRNDQTTENILKEANLANTKFPNVDTYKNPLLFQIYIMWIYFSKSTHGPLKTHHRINAHSDNDKYLNVHDLEISQHVQTYYGEENQNKLFKKFMRPKGEELVVHYLIPSEDFGDEYSRWATYTKMNTVPLWSKVSESMNRIAQYIQNINSELPINTMSITTIVHGTLTLAKKGLIRSTEMEEVYLDSNNSKIPVPKILIKIISYRAPFPIPEDENETCFYTLKDPYKIAIVVHNEVTSISERICGEQYDDYCNQNGWHNVNKRDKNSNAEIIYCCSLNEQVFKKHGYNEVTNLPFNLNNFNLNMGSMESEAWKN